MLLIDGSFGVYDIMQDPKAMRVLAPFMNMGNMFGASDEAQSDVASEAITEDMAKAMMMNMPLRSIASFSGGKLTWDMIQQLVDQVNAAQ